MGEWRAGCDGQGVERGAERAFLRKRALILDGVGSIDRGAAGRLWVVVWGVGGGGQPTGRGSALSFSNAAARAVAQGQVRWRWSLPRRPENARRPATCSSR
jgi:hypothetical protein